MTDNGEFDRVTNNKFGKLPDGDATTPPAKKIVHVVYDYSASDELQFAMTVVEKKDIPEDKEPQVAIIEFVTNLVKTNFDTFEAAAPTKEQRMAFFEARLAGQVADPVGETPFDVGVEDVSYVVMELAPVGGGGNRHNWQFPKGMAGLSTKLAPDSNDCDLLHAWWDPTTAPGKAVFRRGAPLVDGCRVLFFTVARRALFAGCPLNLHLEFFQKGNKRIQLIADPDIKNEGNKPFP